MANPYRPDSLRHMQEELYAWLKANGPATRRQFKEALGWCNAQVAAVIASQPSWLVGVGIIRSDSKHGQFVLYHCEGEHILGHCDLCSRKIYHPQLRRTGLCQSCIGMGQSKIPTASRIVPGVDVSKPTTAKAGSEEKARIIGARMDRGLPLWVEGDERIIDSKRDCYLPEELEE